MACLDRDRLLNLVKEMDQTLDRFLLGQALPAEVVPSILSTCKRLRAAELDDSARYWVGAIEQHASGLDRARDDVAPDEHLFSSSEFLRVHLLRDLCFLRLHLRNAGSAAL
jgi:hypothetical protein